MRLIGGLMCGVVLAGMVGTTLLSPAIAQTDDPCRNPLELPRISVISEARAERTSTKFTADELRTYADRVDPLPTGYRHFGFLEMDRRIRVQANIRSGTDDYKNFCYSPETITVTISIAPTVYVPGEFSRTSCPAGVVRVHQLQHLDIEEQAFRDLPARIKQALQSERELRITLKARDKKDGRQRARDLALRVAERAARQLDSDIRIQHLRLMSAEAYRANLAICGKAEWSGLMN